MKKQLQNFIIGILFSMPIIVNAQFNITGLPINTYGRTNPAMQKIAIGNIPTNADVLAKLHVNQFVLATDLATNGELFRTDASNANINAWRMFNGAAAGSIVEKFSVRNFNSGVGFNGNEISILGLQAECEIFYQQARINMIVRSKTLGIFCENFGATPDDVKLGDGTDVNTTIYAQNFSATVQKGLFLRGSNGNFRMGHFMIPFAFPNIEMDVISTATAQAGSTNQNIFDIVFQGRIHDDTTSNIRLMNATNADNVFVPMIAGFNNRNYFTNATQGMVVSGAIRVSSDIAGFFNTAVVEFDARKRNANGLGGTAIVNRDLFQWCNFNIREMLMDANGQLGLRTATPNNRLEINTVALDPYFGSANGSSGLRFTNMLGGVGLGFSIPVPNPGTGVLSVDSVGNVIYVPGGGQIGNICADSSGILTSDRHIPMNDFNLYFTGQGVPTTNAIGLGYDCSVAMPAKFNVLQLDTPSVVVNTIAGSFINSDRSTVTNRTYRGATGFANGIQPINLIITNVGGEFRGTDAFFSIGARGTADFVTNATKVSTGGAFFARGANNQNIGVSGVANNSTGSNFAVQGIAQGSAGINYGGHFTASGAPVPNYAIYAETDTNTVGNYAGYFVGDVLVTGAFINPSDVNLKENIDTIRNADSLLNLLKPIYFNYKQTGDATRLNMSSSQQMGLIAQEVETVIPNIVKEVIQPASYDSAGTIITPSFIYKSVDYQKVIPLLIAGHKSQQEKIDSLKNESDMQDSINTYLEYKDSILDYRLTVLENALNACCNSHSMQQNNNANSTTAIASQDVSLNDAQIVVLQQNVPNPFAEQTTINYSLPDNVVKAQMLFYNAQGKLIQSVDLNQIGQGSLNVFAQDLSNGIYTYTIVVDGKIIETKKMVKQQ